MNFGMPHRDFTCLQSLDKDGACGPAPPRARAPPGATPTMTDPSHPTLRLPTTLTGGSDSWPGVPTLLSVWLPLTEVTTDNGCMMVVPRTLDRHFINRWAYAHMRPALLGDDDEVLELRFDLQAPGVAIVSTPGVSRELRFDLQVQVASHASSAPLARKPLRSVCALCVPPQLASPPPLSLSTAAHPCTPLLCTRLHRLRG
jgi:hypothetical protein